MRHPSLGAQLAIEYLVKLVEHCWRRFFGGQAVRVKSTLDHTGQWGGKWARVNEMCSLAHNLLKLLIKKNRRCADTLQSIDAAWPPQLEHPATLCGTG